MTLMKTTSALLGLLMIGVIHAGCGDAPLGIDDADTFPTEKLSLDNAALLPEVAFEARGLGLEGYEVYASHHDGQPHDTLREEHEGGAVRHQEQGRTGNERLQAILRQLHLTDAQATAIEECFVNYRECNDGLVEQFHDVRAIAYENFHVAAAEIRTALENGEITREAAHDLYNEAVHAYKADITPIIEAFRAAHEACRNDLMNCIESVLTPAQLQRMAALLAEPPRDGRDHPDDGEGDHPDDGEGDHPDDGGGV